MWCNCLVFREKEPDLLFLFLFFLGAISDLRRKYIYLNNRSNFDRRVINVICFLDKLWGKNYIFCKTCLNRKCQWVKIQLQCFSCKLFLIMAALRNKSCSYINSRFLFNSEQNTPTMIYLLLLLAKVIPGV